METSLNQTASNLAHSVMLTSQWHEILNIAWFYAVSQRSRLHLIQLLPCKVDGVYRKVFCTKWRFIFSSNLLLSLAGGGLNEDNYEKESARVQQLCADLVEESLRVIGRDVCVRQTVCEACAVTQVFAWEAVVGAGFRQPVVYQAGTTRRYQAGALTPWQLFSIIRRSLALSVWILAPKSNVTCVITTQSRVQLISVCDEERVDIIPWSLISGKTTKIGHFVAFLHEKGRFLQSWSYIVIKN